MVISLNGLEAATLSADEAMPGPPLLPSIAKSERVTPLEPIRRIDGPLDEFLRFNVVPNLPAPWSQILALIETEAPGSIMQVPGGMITVAFPTFGLAAEARAVRSAAESSVTPSHTIPVAKTGFMITLGLISGSVPTREDVRGLIGDWACEFPEQPRTILNSDNAQFRIEPPWSRICAQAHPFSRDDIFLSRQKSARIFVTSRLRLAYAKDTPGEAAEAGDLLESARHSP